MLRSTVAWSAPATPAMTPATTKPKRRVRTVGTAIAAAARWLSRTAMSARPLRARRSPWTSRRVSTSTPRQTR